MEGFTVMDYLPNRNNLVLSLSYLVNDHPPKSLLYWVLTSATRMQKPKDERADPPFAEHRQGSNSPDSFSVSFWEGTYPESSVGTVQRGLARKADPNGGLCLLTSSKKGVRVCHLVDTSEYKELKRLECAWGWHPWQLFNIDTRYNLIFLRQDWHFRLHCGDITFIPQLEDLEELDRLASKSTTPSNENVSSVTELWKGRTTFKYHVLAMSDFKQSISRYHGTEKGADREVHPPPFANLGPLISHVHPHFVVENAGEKLSSVTYLDMLDLHATLAKVSSSTLDEAVRRLDLVLRLHRQWKLVKLGVSDVGSGEDDSGGDGNEDDDSCGDAVVSEGWDKGKDPTTDNDDSESVLRDESAWLKDISSWEKDCYEAASQEEWETNLFDDDDEQVVDYAKEEARIAPPPESWEEHVPRFQPPKIPGLRGHFFDTELFCSNDWVLYEGHAPLFGRARP